MNNSKDRLSALSEDLLTHILSFVTTRQAIQMSLLSKRWIYLWTSIPVLCFDEHEFPHLEDRSSTNFRHFIEEVLSLRRDDKNIRKFHFSGILGNTDALVVRDWILHAMRGRDVQQLVIEVSGRGGPGTFELPCSLFFHQSLQSLKLDMFWNWHFKLPNSESSSWCGVKVLHIRDLVIIDDSLGKFISSCPFLEELQLEYCFFENLNISSTQLKKLMICDGGGGKLQVTAPSLLSFKYIPGEFHRSGDSEVCCSLVNLVSLVETDIRIHKLKGLLNGNITVGEILTGISNSSTLRFLYRDKHERLCLHRGIIECLPTFNKLTYLDLHIRLNKDHVESIIYMLEHTPNLKTLVITDVPWFSFIKPKSGRWTPKQMSDQFLLHVKEIKIKEFEVTALYQQFVEFLLNNARGKPRMTIIPYREA